MKKLYTMVDNQTAELFIALCNAMDESIYGRLRKLINVDVEANDDIVQEAVNDPEARVDLENYTDFWGLFKAGQTPRNQDGDMAQHKEENRAQDTQPKKSDDFPSLIPAEQTEESKTDKTKKSAEEAVTDYYRQLFSPSS